MALSNLRRSVHQAFAGDSRDPLDRAGFALLLVTVLLIAAPVLGAGPELATSHGPWLGAGTGVRLVEVSCFLTAAMALLSRSNAPTLRRPAASLAALAGIVLLGACQILPLPERFLKSLAPFNASVYHDALEALAPFGARAPSPRLSLAPAATLDAMLLLLASASLCIACARLLRGRTRRHWLAAAVIVGAIVGATPAILPSAFARAGGRMEIAAARLEIAMATAFALVWAEILTGRSRMQRSLDPSERIERRILPVAFRIVLWLALVGLVAFTGSRAATLAVILTGVLLPLGAMRHSRAGRRSLVACALGLGAAAVASGVALASWSRGEPETASSVRRIAVEAWKNFPVFGSGLGAFAEGFVRVQPSSMPGRISEPGCDGLEVLVTAGVLGAALALLLVVSTIAFLTRAFLRQKHREESSYSLAGLGALGCLLIHGVGASVLFEAAIALSLAAALGAAWAAGSETASAPG